MKTVGDWKKVLEALPDDMELSILCEDGRCTLAKDDLKIDFANNKAYLDTTGGLYKELHGRDLQGALPYTDAISSRFLWRFFPQELEPSTPRLMDVLNQANAGLVRITKMAVQDGEVVELVWEDA